MNRHIKLILGCTLEGHMWMQPHPCIRGCFLPSDSPNLTEMFILSTYSLNHSYGFYPSVQEHRCTIEHASYLQPMVLV